MIISITNNEDKKKSNKNQEIRVKMARRKKGDYKQNELKKRIIYSIKS